jgi:hypothetical protein
MLKIEVSDFAVLYNPDTKTMQVLWVESRLGADGVKYAFRNIEACGSAIVCGKLPTPASYDYAVKEFRVNRHKLLKAGYTAHERAGQPKIERSWLTGLCDAIDDVIPPLSPELVISPGETLAAALLTEPGWGRAPQCECYAVCIDSEEFPELVEGGVYILYDELKLNTNVRTLDGKYIGEFALSRFEKLNISLGD